MREDPFIVDIDIRYNDVDLLGHVNNAVYVSYLEEARVEYLPEVLGDTDALDGVIANLEIDYHRPITLEDDVSVAIAITEVGNSTLHFEYEVRASGEVAATATTVQVAYDAEAGESRELPEAWKQRVREFEGL
ncbi:acyl-CoA thioesterase [Haloarchaeobius sp. DYHT-AS-18]|uniref:acyl-CoA thioesterase n=1 Tax=Haloarchaeobius sp. DYHT-AS-18 TaxID=3446117 RepID=UPI003EBA75D0